ncbi:hypothetical protein GCM10007424_02140 [Flavobacterium suaedae]|uniref:Anti-sigma factor n=1 Tax=Flavobacterium suaedae TaxID=1767027 RepID=A0ABQ1JH03_9FLAO|nr:hypothetical protein [Flavobacterium suaedae]GGB65786.1 hypothetical protein GCM10007424_02140 [Flavobacterium suaedae]
MKNFKLDNEKKVTSGFKAPEGYFDNFTDKVMKQLPEKETKVVPLYKSVQKWYGGVAAILVILFGVGLFFKLNTSGDEIVQPDASTIENYLVYQSDITNEDLYQSLNESDIEILEENIQISNEAIENYIAYENEYEYYIND